MKKSIIYCGYLIYGLFAYGEDISTQGYVPTNGYICSAEVAIKVAEAILIPIYGAQSIKRQRPLNAELCEGLWRVTGTMPRGIKGGVVCIEIEKESGCVVNLSHGK